MNIFVDHLANYHLPITTVNELSTKRRLQTKTKPSILRRIQYPLIALAISLLITCCDCMRAIQIQDALRNSNGVLMVPGLFSIRGLMGVFV